MSEPREFTVITFSDQNGVFDVVLGETEDSAWEAAVQVLLDTAREAANVEVEPTLNELIEQARRQMESNRYRAAAVILLEGLQIQENIFTATLPETIP